MRSHPLDYFDKIFVINLASRTDRRNALLHEFSAIGFTPSNVQWFDAIRPDDKGPFESVGTRGCFLSHLGVLQRAEREGVDRLLILEDDASFAEGFSARMSEIVPTLMAKPWDVFYGGGRVAAYEPHFAPGLSRVAPDVGVGCAHFIAIRGSRIADLRVYLEAQLGRPEGDPNGGPMAVDGSYSWARRELGLITMIASPDACIQRSSRSDITPKRWDILPGLRQAAALFRKLRAATPRKTSRRETN